MKRLPGIYARGMAMGAADVVPGVSGGTLALITGIYEELIESLGGLHIGLLMVWRHQGFRAFWHTGNFSFLLSLFGGIFTSIILFARLITWLMVSYPVPLWAFFCGLIVASVWVILRPVQRFTVALWVSFIVGATAAWWVGSLPGLQNEVGRGALAFFLSGGVAICAMILPGISGSFILVLLGMYEPVLMAVKQGQWPLLFAFVFGCAAGLLAFVHLLKWLLHRFHDPVMGLLAGFMLGSLNKLWPWHVKTAGAAQDNVLPAVYQQITGLPAMVPAAVAAMFVGALVVSVMIILDMRQQKNKSV
ncbi:MAG: DUF368 domain-containing protein [Alcanivoracaceae bacterium]|nr:DUF368 domain-containing protein [Alcanivoracaceae bacterium]